MFAKFTVSNPMATASLPMIAIDFFNQTRSVTETRVRVETLTLPPILY